MSSIQRIVSDEQGSMLDDMFYSVSNDAYSFIGDIPPLDKKRWRVIHPRHQARLVDLPLYADASESQLSGNPGIDCLAGAPWPHARQTFFEITGGDVFGGPTIPDFIIDSAYGLLICSKDLSLHIRRSNLSGFDLREFHIKTNQSDVAVNLSLFALQAVGVNCARPKIVTGKNECPHCGLGKVVCPECGMIWNRCPECGHEMRTTELRHGGKSDKRLILESTDPNKEILELSRWDGADFIASHRFTYMSRRALDWLQRKHAGPLIGIPVRACIDGMNDRQRKMLRDMSENGSGASETFL